MIKSKAKIVSVFLALFTSFSAVAHDASLMIDERVRECAGINKAEKRYLCYDNLGADVIGAESKERSINSQTSGSADLPNTLGGGKFEKSKEDSKANVGKVVSCKPSQDGRLFFFFSNGQVWKQTDRKKHRFRDCEFAVSVKNDSFGYFMRLESKKGKIRIKRIR